MTNALTCKWCGSQNSKVIDSRKKQNTIFRTRECQECHRHWITTEAFLHDIAWNGKGAEGEELQNDGKGVLIP